MRNRRYFDFWDFEHGGRFYERLGIRWFKRFATKGDYWNKVRRHFDPTFRNVKDCNSAIEWESRTRFNEVIPNPDYETVATGCVEREWNDYLE